MTLDNAIVSLQVLSLWTLAGFGVALVWGWCHKRYDRYARSDYAKSLVLSAAMKGAHRG